MKASRILETEQFPNFLNKPARVVEHAGAIARRLRLFGLLGLFAVVLVLAGAPASVRAFTLFSSNQLVFVDVDHAPVGACSTLAYGLDDHGIGPNGDVRSDWCGLMMSSGSIPGWGGGGGVVIALSGPAGLRAFPFVASPTNIAAGASFFPGTNVQRTLTPGADQWTISPAGLKLTHYSPPWSMARLDTASLADKKRFFLPATWIEITVTNNGATTEDLYFGLPRIAMPQTFANGAYQGFVSGEAALAVQSGSCDLLSGPALAAALNGMSRGFAFHLAIPPGQTRTLTVVVAFYRTTVVDSRITASYYYTSLFSSIDNVVDAAFAGFADARMRCGQLASAMAGAGLNPYRQFLASHALHSYMANTACLIDPAGGVHWRIPEGFYNYINTFDLTVDMAFYDALMNPWALRNVLDTYSGAINGAGYSYDHALYDALSGAQVSSHGFSFHHDMGNWPTSHAPGTDPTFDDYMGAEQLQNWILCAGLYWSRTGDHAWLTNNTTLLQTCLNSLLMRDSANPAARDGVIKNINRPEGTTFDDLDSSLQAAGYSGRLAVRNWACYLALEAMFNQVGDTADAGSCHTMAATTAQTIVNRWNTYRSSPGYIPALLNGANLAATIPMVEGLAFPAQMGLTNALDRTAGPYAAMLQALSNHLAAILVPGRCLNATSGAWDMTSATAYQNNHNTWQSKMYLAQYVAEQILGLTGNNVNGTVDQVHATIQMTDAPFMEWSDQTDGTGAERFIGSCHYPRGVTSALWWLNATNNPAYPIPAAPPEAPALRALAGDRQVLLNWNGVALAAGYNLKRSTSSGGPYTPVAGILTGASFVDTALANGTTYYYVVAATNQVGEGPLSLEVSATPVPAAATSLVVQATGGAVTVLWPSDYTGWILQTNAIDPANKLYWGDLPSSQSNRQMTFPAPDPAMPQEFFRLRHP